MPKFFVDGSQIKNGKMQITGQDAHHIFSVLRLAPGNRITVCDGQGTDYDCLLQAVDTESAWASVLERSPSGSEPAIKISLFQSLPKGAKMELIIQKTVELGVHEIIPVLSENTVVKLRPGRGHAKEERWQKISEAAAKQCGRGIIPQVLPPVSLEQAAAAAAALDFSVAAHEKERCYGLKQALGQMRGQSLGIFIGPEGGFSQNEIEMLVAGNILPVSLGRRVLRTETAGFTALLLSLYEKNEL